MKRLRLTYQGLGLSILGIISTTTHAGIPVWSFSPIGNPIVTVSATGTATVKYTIINNSKKPHQLLLSSLTPAGISQVGGPCILVAKTPVNPAPTCILTLNINGNALPANKIVGGPVLCQANSNGTPNANQCYQPGKADSLNITVKAAPTSVMVTSGYYKVGAPSYPLLANSTDGGVTWTYSITSSSPAWPGNWAGGFHGSSCSGSNCIVAGVSNADGSTPLPLLANSTDGGVTWAYRIINNTPILPDLDRGLFYNASCSGLNCIASGNYGVGYPLLANSTDGGVTWAYGITSSTPGYPNDAFYGIFQGSSCSGSNCIASGYYRVGANDSYPLLANSTDGGVTWKYNITKNSPALPSGIDNGFLKSPSCSGSNCIASGYGISASPFRAYPLLASSTDGGITWAYRVTNSIPTWPNGFDGEFTNSSCSGSNCIASGSYYSNLSQKYPLLANSTDGGVTWTYSITNSTPALPGDWVSGEFTSSSCSGSNCIASGYYENGVSDYPLLANSIDGGVTWTYSITSSMPALPDNWVSGEFTSSSCSGSNCIASGYYGDGVNDYPLLANSTDGGVTWTYNITSSTPVFPGVSGQFSNTSVSTASFLPDYLR